jgi:hypothetical protein
MTSSFSRPTFPRPRCGSDAPMMHRSQADLRRAGYNVFQSSRAQPVV